MGSDFDSTASGAHRVDVEAHPERRLIRRDGCPRYIDFQVVVMRLPDVAPSDRAPLGLALVLDRSGSMQGEKLRTAKRAALAVLDRLDERDGVAVVVFDDKIDTVQAAAPATSELKAHVRSAFAEIEARAMTALHEGWLTGCKAIAADDANSAQRLARCFLLTDGLANVGERDPERIAAEAAGIRERAGISTSTFGIGEDYSEELLGPMAQAGGGSFYHLRSAGEIATTFLGELGQLLAVAAARARLEIEVEPGTRVDVLSGYWASTAKPDAAGASDASDASDANQAHRWSVALGDLLSGDEHHVVVHFDFPPQAKQVRREVQVIRARLTWSEGGAARSTTWRELCFTYADAAACDAEPRDPTVMRYAGQHLSDRSHREAIRRSKTGDVAGARALLSATLDDIAGYAGSDPALQAELEQLRQTQTGIAHAPLPSSVAKERYFQAQTRSSGKKDRRGGGGASTPADSTGGAAKGKQQP
jgi:Ca-activated chloride channel family protein